MDFNMNIRMLVSTQDTKHCKTTKTKKQTWMWTLGLDLKLNFKGDRSKGDDIYLSTGYQTLDEKSK